MPHRLPKQLWDYMLGRPAFLLLSSFAATILAGTLLLWLPFATPAEDGLSLIDALFTSTSAVCVTGLIVVDTGTQLSLFGQVVVVGLIQVGGLGIITISTFIALAIGANLGLRGEFAVQETMGEARSRSALHLIRFVITGTFLVELVGVVVLTLLFNMWGFGPAEALYQAVFHTVSAFCNAGFSLFHDSMVRFDSMPAIPLTISLLFIFGGLGFSVLLAIFYSLLYRERFPYYPRIVLIATFVLIVSGTAMIWALEYNHAFQDMPMETSLLHSFFQAVTPRTAGFNTFPIHEMSTGSLVVIIFLMFVGAGPGSTAGGVKITTAVVLASVVWAVIRGRSRVVLSGRRISETMVYDAVALVGCSLLVVMAVFAFLSAIEPHPPIELLFESFSAFGTVGLSMGVTAELSSLGKVAITLLMYIGRVGPLTFLVLVRPTRQVQIDYPEAKMIIG